MIMDTSADMGMLAAPMAASVAVIAITMTCPMPREMPCACARRRTVTDLLGAPFQPLPRYRALHSKALTAQTLILGKAPRLTGLEIRRAASWSLSSADPLALRSVPLPVRHQLHAQHPVCIHCCRPRW